MPRYKSDFYSLFIVAMYFVTLAYAFTLELTLSWGVFGVIAALCYLSFTSAVITHNTVHVSIFKERWKNRIMQVFLTLTYGHPVSSFVPGHNLSHHNNTQTDADVMRTTKARFKWNFLNQFFFAAIVGGAIQKADFQFFMHMRKKKPAWHFQFMLEFTAMAALTIFLLVFDWQKFLAFFFLPHIYAAWGIIGINYIQHDGCDETHPYNHSRNWTGWLLNFLQFNNGYHAIHHLMPNVHWSKLPKMHKEHVEPYNHPNLNVDFAPGFLWKQYIWPGKRLTYDGKPVKLPPKSADAPWIPEDVDNLPSSISLGVGGA